MNRDQFEKKVLSLWMETRIPLTAVNVQYYTKAPRKKVSAWLDDLVREDVLEMIVGNDGEVFWKVRGARRPIDGPVRFEDMGGGDTDAGDDLGDHLDRLKSAASGALAVRNVRDELQRKPSDGDRSLLISGGASLLLGPLGWLYAGAWKEAIPATAIYLFLIWLLPSFLLMPILGLAAPVSLVAGIIYAYKYNKSGHRRQPILDWDKDK